MSETKKGMDWGSLAIGILFIIASLLSFKDPVSNLASIVMILASFAILKGIFEIFLRRRMKELTGIKSYATLVMGIINIIVGVYFLFNIKAGVMILPYIFAIWFLSDSILSLFTLELAKRISTSYFWFALITNLLGIGLGILLIFNPISSALTLSFLVGFYFMIFGINRIVYAFGQK